MGSQSNGIECPEQAGAILDWEAVTQTVEERLEPKSFGLGVVGTYHLHSVNGKAKVSAPSAFLVKYGRENLADVFLEAARAQMPELSGIAFVRRGILLVEPKPEPKPQPVEPKVLCCPSERAKGKPEPGSANGASPIARGRADAVLSLDAVVAGRENDLALQACRHVATARRSEPAMFNPLYVWGAGGCGKSLLLRAMVAQINGAHTCGDATPSADPRTARLLSAHQLRYSRTFSDALLANDVLAIDDLHLLLRCAENQFSAIIGCLIASGRQLVVAANCPPVDLDFDERLRSRLSAGVALSIGNPGDEMRLEMLCAKVNAEHARRPAFDVPAPVVFRVARAVHSGHALDGAFNMMLAHHLIKPGEPMTMEVADSIVHNIAPAAPKVSYLRVEDIQRAAARHFNVTRMDLMSARRDARVVLPRQIAMYLAKALTLRSLPDIGRRFGGRDHTTVLHAVRKITALVETDPELAKQIDVLKGELGAGAVDRAPNETVGPALRPAS